MNQIIFEGQFQRSSIFYFLAQGRGGAGVMCEYKTCEILMKSHE